MKSTNQESLAQNSKVIKLTDRIKAFPILTELLELIESNPDINIDHPLVKSTSFYEAAQTAQKLDASSLEMILNPKVMNTIVLLTAEIAATSLTLREADFSRNKGISNESALKLVALFAPSTIIDLDLGGCDIGNCEEIFETVINSRILHINLSNNLNCHYHDKEGQKVILARLKQMKAQCDNHNEQNKTLFTAIKESDLVSSYISKDLANIVDEFLNHPINLQLHHSDPWFIYPSFHYTETIIILGAPAADSVASVVLE
jgi:hypothetical protein